MSQPYHALQQLLEKINAEVSPASVHGLWCGRFATGDTPKNNQWWDYTMRMAGLAGEVDNNILAAFQAVAGFAEANLQQDNFSFEPWLPADSTECSLRVSALADWCRGFIEGLISVKGPELMEKSPEVKEVVQDLLAIGEVDSEVSGTDEDERQLLELSEFVKVAALNLYHELGVVSSGPGAAGHGSTLH
ncbi:hypothetical protein BTA51_00410 [Hahella sp. CCB-MM4]|uniref:UPF0149 family protein n=1 Tax=Hahella sp. (strain CCB-MM4) TaxID=1926491 RepID=UPI000B9AEE14|nr:UPF0149 family protein [Hahella sp. CCB-MM4]OZG74904.1 hypothetical protein BTA51_00410 [Hahella sp. CCB-MM4]